MSEPSSGPLKRTPLHALHQELGARLVPFAGYEMPVQYPTGILAEHAQTRTAAGLFDVSHMGQVRLTAKAGGNAAKALEALVPGDIAGLQPGQQRYTQFTNDTGGILDDLMVTSTGDHLLLIVNAACKDDDLAHIQKHLSATCEVEPMFARGLLALQGPLAVQALARLVPSVASLKFMTGAFVTIDGAQCYVTRSGYTGGDGFEISTPADKADPIARLLLAQPEVKPIGLGARDSLRLEAGLCLYGHDIDTTTTPIEAGLLWSIGKERRAQGGFPGAAVIRKQIADGAPRKRIGLLPEGKAIAREGTEIAIAGKVVGKVTSGGFAPTLGRAVAMGTVERGPFGDKGPANGTRVELMVRGKPVPADIAPMPFVKHAYYRGRESPMTVRYSNEHEWIRVEGDVGTVGISNYAQEQLGDVVFVDLPQAGRKVAKGESVAVVESVKAASDIYSPAAGEIVEANAALADAPGEVNADPMGKGWFYRIKLDNLADTEGLMDQAAYDAFVKSLG